MDFSQDDKVVIASKALQAFMLFLESGLESVRKFYPEYYSFVEENKEYTYREVKKKLAEPRKKVFA